MSPRTVATVLSVALAAAGCGTHDATDDPSANGPASAPLLDPPTDGFQLTSVGTTIHGGEDVEYCELAYLPGEPGQEILMNRFETAFDGYSHHLLVFAIEPATDAARAIEETYEVGKPKPCSAGRDIGIGFTIVAGSQKPYSDVLYPERVGRRLVGGQPILWNYHHVNGSTGDALARHAVNVHVVDSLDFIARTAAFANLTIDTPPRQKASFTGECRYSHDLRLWSITRHTHEWGTNFDVWFAGGDRDGEHVWTSKDYELDTNYIWDDTIVMKAGEGFRFQCSYDNTTDHALRFGEKATDEMCILFGQWWVLDPTDDVPSQFCVMNAVDADGIARGSDPSGVTPP